MSFFPLFAFLPSSLTPTLPHSHPPSLPPSLTPFHPPSLYPFLPPTLPTSLSPTLPPFPRSPGPSHFQVITRTLANYWMDWADLPPEALTTIAKGAYYSTKITDKLKLISFNSDYGSVSKSNKAVSSYTSAAISL